jgi:hypothetical protein
VDARDAIPGRKGSTVAEPQLAERTRARQQTNASSSGANRRGAVPATTRVRVPELVLGVLLVAGFGLATVVWHARSAQVTPIAVLAHDVPRGATLVAGDLKPVATRLEPGLEVVPWSRAGTLVGRTAVADLRAGTPLAPGLAVDRPALAGSDALVSLRLAAGAYPDQLATGDRVDAVLMAGASPEDAAASPVTVASGTVWDVAAPTDSESGSLVTVRLDPQGAHRLAAAAAQVRLVRIGG